MMIMMIVMMNDIGGNSIGNKPTKFIEVGEKHGVCLSTIIYLSCFHAVYL